MKLLPFLSLFFFSLVLGSPADVFYLEKLVADEAQSLDAKDFAELANIFTKNATYNSETSLTVFGIDNIQALLSGFFPPEIISQNSINTESFTLLPPFNEQGAADAASGVVYTTVSFIGQSNLAGQVYAIFAKYKDKYVKTGESAHYGGWRIYERVFVSFVSFPKPRLFGDPEGRGGGGERYGRYAYFMIN